MPNAGNTGPFLALSCSACAESVSNPTHKGLHRLLSVRCPYACANSKISKQSFLHLLRTQSICRGTVILGFEQANKYTILNEEGETVALMSEELGGVGRQIGRQLLRTHRPFTATVFSPDGATPNL